MDFDAEQIAQIAAQTGAPPDFVAQQLVAEGHRVAAPAPAAAPQQWGVNAGNLRMPQQAPDYAGVGVPDRVAQQLQVQDFNQQQAASMGPVDVPPGGFAPASAPPTTQTRRGVRATGQGAPTQGATGAAGGPSRVRKLFDAREQALTGEADSAIGQVRQGQQKLEQIGQQVFEGQQEQLDLQASAAQRKAQTYDDYNKQMAQAEQQEAIAREKEQQVIAAKEADLDRATDEYTGARVQEMPAGSRVASAFALAFSTIADALNAGVGNQSAGYAAATQAIIDKAIDRDVDEQLRQIRAKGERVTNYERSLARLRDTVGDERAFRSATRAGYYQQFAHRAEQIAAESASETAQATAKAALPVFQQSVEAARQEARMAHMADVQKQLREANDQQIGFEGQLALKQTPAGGAGKKPTPGVVGLAQVADKVTPEDRTKAQGIVSGAAGIVDTIGSLKEMAKRGATLSPDERSIARRRLGSLKSQFNGVFGDGTAPNESQLKALDDMFANPTELNVGDAHRQFEVFEQDANRQTNAKLRPYGFQLGAEEDFQPE